MAAVGGSGYFTVNHNSSAASVHEHDRKPNTGGVSEEDMFDKFFNLSTQLAKDSLAPMWTQAHQTAAKADAANAKDPGSPKTLALLEKAASEARTAFKLADKADMPTDFLKNAHRFADLRTKISHDAQIAVRPEPGWKGERHS